MSKKNKQQIKFEADITGLKSEIKEGEQSIRSLTKELKLNQEQLRGSKDDINLLATRVKTLQDEYEKQTQIVELSNQAYEKAVEMLGENSEEARKWKDKVAEAEAKQQKIKNAIDETNKELKIQSERLITTGKKWQETGDHITKLGDKINSIGNKLSVISAGTAGIAVTALKASIDYESAFAGVTKTVEGTEEQLQSIRKGILDMSAELPTSASEIASVAESAGQLGIKTDDILSFTRVMIDLGESTNLSSTEAASSLAKFANVTKMSAKDYDRLGSTIVALGNNFATTEADIVSMATRLAATGELTGLSEAQIMALATAMSSVGIEAEAGGSAMSKLLKKIQVAVETGSDELEDFAKVAGMSSKDFKKAFEEDAVSALSSFISGLNDTEKNGKSAVAILDDMGLTEVRLSNTILSLANSSGVMTDAIKLANKSWKDNTALSKEATTRYKTTGSQIKMLKNEATKLAVEFGDELAPSLRQILKDAKPLLNNISDAIKRFSELDEKTKQNIIRMGALVVALGPATKAVGGITSAIGNGIKGVGSLSQALGNLKNGTNEGSDGVKSLTSIISKVASPAGAATIAITGLTAASAALIYKKYESSRASKEVLEDVKKEIEAQDELAKSYDNSKNAVFAEMNNIEKLTSELDKLVDENGRVKDGYEKRVDFILGQLNAALGTEYSRTGDLVDKYNELKESIEEVILKKKLSALMESEQGKYDDAIANKADIYSELIDLEDELAKKEEALRQAEERQNNNKASENLDKIGSTLSGLGNGNIMSYITALGTTAASGTISASYAIDVDNAKKDLDNTRKALELKRQLYEKQLEYIRQYESDYVIMTSGTNDEINNLIARRTTYYSNATDDIAGEIQQKIENQLYDLNVTKRYLEDSIKNKDEATKQECEIQKKSQEKQLEILTQNLVAMTSTTESMTPAQITAWSQLATQSSDIYANVLSELPPTTVRKIQDATGKVVSDEALEAAFKELGRESIDSFSQNDFEGMGKSAIERLANGTWSGRGFLQSTAKRLSEQLKLTPSVSSANSGNADGLAYVPFDNYVARLHEGERVLTKREN